MRALTWVLLAILIALCVLVSGCATPLPKPPEKIYITVEKYKPLPQWATIQLAKPMPENGTVGALWYSEFARGSVIDLLNCHRRLLAKLDAGETVDPKECASD